jgi:hypothetical protein
VVRQSALVALTSVFLPAILVTTRTPTRGEEVNWALGAVAPVHGPTRAAQPSSFPGTLQLHNRRWDRVRVEVRVGPSDNCENNEVQGPSILRRDETWTVVSAESICWRRDQVPSDPSAGWTAWERTRLAPDAIRDVTL